MCVTLECLTDYGPLVSFLSLLFHKQCFFVIDRQLEMVVLKHMFVNGTIAYYDLVKRTHISTHNLKR